MVSAAVELANEFEFHLGLAKKSVEEGLISPELLSEARAVDSKFEEMSSLRDSSLWTDDGIKGREEWEEVRKLPRSALAAMGYALEPPPDWRKTTRIDRAGRRKAHRRE